MTNFYVYWLQNKNISIIWKHLDSALTLMVVCVFCGRDYLNFSNEGQHLSVISSEVKGFQSGFRRHTELASFTELTSHSLGDRHGWEAWWPAQGGGGSSVAKQAYHPDFLILGPEHPSFGPARQPQKDVMHTGNFQTWHKYIPFAPPRTGRNSWVSEHWLIFPSWGKWWSNND